MLVSRDRVAGAAAISARGLHDLILMDDGLQNPFLKKDLKIGVFDGAVGIGNGRVIPAGPLRASLGKGLAELDLALINGKDETGLAQQSFRGYRLFMQHCGRIGQKLRNLETSRCWLLPALGAQNGSLSL